MRTTITTNSGLSIDIINPKDDDILIEDIATGLSKIPRFCGHLSIDYKVAQHCLHGCRVLETYFPAELMTQFAFLLHDATEAYYCDLPSPLKNTSWLAGYKSLEQMFARQISSKFGIIEEEVNLVLLETLDKELGRAESRAMHVHHNDSIWDTSVSMLMLIDEVSEYTEKQHTQIKDEFLEKFYELKFRLKMEG